MFFLVEPRHPEEFVAEQSTTDSNEEKIDISWKHPSSPNPSSQVRSYTVYWCRGAHLIQICQVGSRDKTKERKMDLR